MKALTFWKSTLNYNADGANIQHGDFFKPMEQEITFWLDVVDDYVPDTTVLLHGLFAECPN